MDEREIRKTIREYLIENILLGEEESEFPDDESFLESGILDSTGILEVITFLEDTYDIVIDDEEMVPENLDSVSNIARFVSSKKAG